MALKMINFFEMQPREIFKFCQLIEELRFFRQELTLIT